MRSSVASVLLHIEARREEMVLIDAAAAALDRIQVQAYGASDELRNLTYELHARLQSEFQAGRLAITADAADLIGCAAEELREDYDEEFRSAVDALLAALEVLR